MTAEAAREARARRRAKRLDLLIRKSRTRIPERRDFGMFFIIDPFDNVIVAGGYEPMDLDDMEE